jgi:hypothetical protein
MMFTGSSRTTRYGFDFSKNLTPNFELHGEFAVVNNLQRQPVDARGRPQPWEAEALSYLFGVRYLTEKETTYILEYYHNGTGFSREQFRDFTIFVDRSYETFRSTGNDNGLLQASRLAEAAYGSPNPMRDYLYFRASQKEPFDILYFTPALTSIVNLQDASFVVIPELAYSPMTNLDLRLRTPVLIGGRGTEYGERQNDYRVEFRMRYHFQY